MKHISNSSVRSLWACLLLGLSCNTGWAQDPYSGNAYPGGLPWDRRQQYYEQLPADRGGFYEEESPLDRLLKQSIAQSWFQMDYVQWSLEDSSMTLGAPVPGNPNPENGFVLNNVETGAPTLDANDSVATNFAPTLDGIELNNHSGLRLTYGLNTNYGLFEANVMWIFKDTRTSQPGPPFPYQSDTPINLNLDLASGDAGITSLPFSYTVNGGTPSSTLVTQAIAFNGGLDIAYQTSIFSTEINFIQEDHRPENGFRFRPLYGIRYVRLDERLSLNGRSINDQGVVTGDAMFNSESLNHIWGPQLGAKMELQDEYFTLGAKTAFTLGFNRIEANVNGNNPLFPFTDQDPDAPDPSLGMKMNEATKNVIAPMVSLSLYTQIRLMERVKLYGSYDILYLDSVSRAYNAIIYEVPDVPTSSPQSGFDVSTRRTGMFNHGFSVGLLFDF